MDTLLFYKIIVMLKKHGSRNSCAGSGGSPIKKIKTSHPALSNSIGLSGPVAQRISSPLCSFPPASPGEPGRRCLDLSACGSDSLVRMGTEAILLCGRVLGLPPAAPATWAIAAAFRITATGGICMCFLTSRFLEAHMASFMAARVSHCLGKSGGS